MGSPVCSAVEDVARTIEHFPEKWRPVFRRKCDHLKSSRPCGINCKPARPVGPKPGSPCWITAASLQQAAIGVLYREAIARLAGRIQSRPLAMPATTGIPAQMDGADQPPQPRDRGAVAGP